jgi:mono/diheme cytochrome c family protein
MRYGLLSAALLAAACAGSGSGSPGEQKLRDVRGVEHTISTGLAVLAFTSTECPMSNARIPRLIDLSREFPEVAFFSVNPNCNQPAEEAARHAEKFQVPFPTVKDADQGLARRFGVETVPAAVVLDSGQVRYRGRIDDHKILDCVRRHDLREALLEIRSGRPVSVPETPVEGCLVMAPPEPSPEPQVTYAGHVSRILNRHCVTCHHPDGPAVFSLADYKQASAWARSIKRATESRRMPPWKPAGPPGLFYDERRLSEEEIETLARWADDGAPPGRPEEMPEPPRFTKDWVLGTPDLEVTAEGVAIEAKGKDDYRCYILKTDFKEDRYVQAIELRPGNLRVVHHLIVWVDTSGTALRADRKDSGPGYATNGTDPGFMPAGLIGGWAPGHVPRRLPPGLATFVPRGATLVLDTHYHKSGRPEIDPGTKIGFHFARGPIEKIVRTKFFFNIGFKIPAGAENFPVTSKWTVREDIHALAIVPHMHLLGRQTWATARFPDGREQELIRIPDWDFNWQETYGYAAPVALPKGTTITHTSIYDNSERNLNNPHRPPKDIRWGSQTTDEMHILFVAYTVDREHLGASDGGSK